MSAAKSKRRKRAPKWIAMGPPRVDGNTFVLSEPGRMCDGYFGVVTLTLERAWIDGAYEVRERREVNPYYFREHGDLAAFGAIALTCVRRMRAAAAQVEERRKRETTP